MSARPKNSILKTSLKALWPALLLAQPAFASVRSSSVSRAQSRTAAMALPGSGSLSNNEPENAATQSNPFASFGTSVGSEHILPTELAADTLAFLAEQGLLVPGAEQQATESGQNFISRKEFAAFPTGSGNKACDKPGRNASYIGIGWYNNGAACYIYDSNGFPVPGKTGNSLSACQNLYNACVVVSAPAPTITSATYDASTGALVVTGTNFTATGGAPNDVIANKLTFTGEGGATYTLTNTTNVEISTATSFTLTLSSTDRAALDLIVNKDGTSSTGATTYNLAGAAGFIAASAAATDTTGNSVTVSNVQEPTVTSATYNASTGALVITGTNLKSASGAANDIVANKFTFTGEGGSTYTLTDTANAEISSGTSASLTLSATDKAALNLFVNKNGTSSTSGTNYNLAAAEDWNSGAASSVVIADTAGNGVTVSNVAVPAITSATYDATTGVLVVTGTDFLSKAGASNDIDGIKFSYRGEGGSGSTFTFTDTASVELTSGTSFSLVLGSADKEAFNLISGKAGTSGVNGSLYQLNGLEDWAAGADATTTTSDSGNVVTVSNIAPPTITAATYNIGTGVMVVTGSGFVRQSGSTNDIVANKFVITGEGGSTYTLTNTTNVEVTSSTSFTLTFSATDQTNVASLVNKNGTSSSDGTTYNLAAAEDWAGGADAAVNVADLTGNGITASGAAASVASVTASTADGAYKAGDVVTVQVNFSANVTVTGTPQLTLETGATDRTINYSSGSGTSTLTFSYTVQAGDTSSDLDYISVNALSLNGGTIKDGSTVDAILTLPAPGAANSLGANKALVIDTTAPTATIVVADTSLNVSETSLVTITFSEAVTGFNNNDLTIENGTLTAVGSADGGITWTATLTPTVGITDSTNVITLNNTDVADATGNAGVGTTNSNNYAIDTVRPTATVVVSDNSLTAGETSLVTITFSEAVTGFNNNDLTIENGSLSAVSSSDGGVTWTATLTPTVSITDATNVITLDNTDINDVAGNTGTGTTNSNNYAIDTARPTASIVVADTSLKSGETSLVTFTFSEAVTGFTNADLTIANGTLTAVSSADGGITWTATFTPSAGVTASTNQITLDNTGVADAAGNTGTGTTNSNNYAIDNVAPNAPSTPDLAAGSDLGNSSTDDVTNDTTPTLTGTAESDSTVTLYDTDGTTVLGSATATGGDWSITSSVLSEGSHTLTAKAVDTAGNESVASAGLTITIDTTAPLVTGSVPDGAALINAASLTYTVSFNDTVYGLASADFSVTATGTAAGTVSSVSAVSGNSVDVTVSGITGTGTLRLDSNASGIADLAGNQAAAFTAGSTHAVDRDAPAITSVGFDQASVDSANQAAVSFTLAGAETASTASYTITSSSGGTPVTASGIAVNSAGQTISGVNVSGLNDGTLTLSLTLTDTAGNVSSPVTDTVVKDANVPAVTAVAIANGSFKAGDSINFTVTLNDSVTVSGMNSTLGINVGGANTTAAFVSATGNTMTYSYTVVAGENTSNSGVAILSDSISLNGDTIRDSGNNDAVLTFAATSNSAAQVDTTAPALTVVTDPAQAVFVNAANYQIKGTHSEIGLTINLYADTGNDGTADGGVLVSAVVDADGNWSLVQPLTADTAHNYVVIAEDAAGNVSAAVDVATITEDSIAPVAPVVTSPATALAVNTLSQLISGTHAEDGVTVELFADADNDGVADNSTVLASAEVGVVTTGNWSLTAPLTQNTANNFVVIAKDKAANGSAAVDVVTVTQDSVAPVVTVTTLTTADSTPALAGTVDDTTATLSLVVNGQTYTATNNGNGGWTLADNQIAALPHGVYDLVVTATDAQGNQGTDASTNELTIDLLPPSGYSAVIQQNRIDAANQNAMSFVFAGAEVGSTYTYVVSDGTNSVTNTGVVTAVNQQIGPINVTGLAEGTLQLSVILTDTVGNAGAAATATVVKLFNATPVISGSPATSVNEDSLYSFTPVATDTDAGTTLTFSISNKPTWASFDTATGALTGTPTNDHVGTTSAIVISVSDGTATASLAAFAITVVNVNDAPVVTSTAVTSATQGSPYSYSFTATDVDAGDTLTRSVVTAPAWLTFNAGTAVLSGIPANNDVGAHAVTLRVTDAAGLFADQSFTVTVANVNDAPSISGTPAITVAQGAAYSFVPAAADVDVGTSLTFSIANKPTWASFNTATGALTGTPGNADVGVTAGIVISVSDGELSAALPAFTLTVTNVNDAPVVTDSAATTLEDTPLSLTLTAQDPDQDPLTFEIMTQPEHGTATVQGSLVLYTPNPDFNGSDSIGFVAKDAELSSNVATISLTVTPVNDNPVLLDDSYSLQRTENNQYLLNVLANDTDVDGDTLTIDGASASVGTVSFNAEGLTLTAPDRYVGPVSLRYTVTDAKGGRASANVSLIIEGGAASSLPVITVPADIEVNATALFTRVPLGTATAVDSTGRRLRVSLINGSLFFQPGEHIVYWQATDAAGNTATQAQKVSVKPLISLSKDQQVTEGREVVVEVILNGPAPVYPVLVPYTVSGSADGNDHTLVSGVAEITSGFSTSIRFTVLEDGQNEGTEDIVISLDASVNRGSQRTSRIVVTEANIAPVVTLDVNQSNESRLTVSESEGIVRVTATVTDANPLDQVSGVWNLGRLVNATSDQTQLSFDPADQGPGLFEVSYTATDNGTPNLSSSTSVFIVIRPSLPVLGSQDSDGDLIPDDQEGFADSNGNGIPDYLDALDECNVMPTEFLGQTEFLAEGDPGVCLRLGTIAAETDAGGLQIAKDAVATDNVALNIGGIFDFIAYGLPEQGQSYSLVIPQRLPVPANAVYRKYSNVTGWVAFVSNERNSIASTQGERGFCPPPGGTEWTPGLTEGHWCVQVTVEDGGPNDADGIANSAIVDPGGVAVELNGNNLPVAVADQATTRADTAVVVNVLANDTDPDGDTLTVSQAVSSFGTVTILADQQLSYSPNPDFIGIDTVIYNITDGQGGTASSELVITVLGNTAPVAVNDSASTDDKTVLLINVLANDSDEDGNTLIISNASAVQGAVSIEADQRIRYTPKAGFDGVDIISYTITDGAGGEASAQVSVTVRAYKDVVVDNKSSGGSMTWWMVMILAGAVILRRRSVLGLAAVALLSFSPFSQSADWYLQGSVGHSKADQKQSRLVEELPSGTITGFDDSSASYGLYLGYQLHPVFALELGYQDLGEASSQITAQSLTPEQYHELVKEVSPVLADGFTLGGRYTLWQNEQWAVEVPLGLMFWKFDIESRRDDSVIRSDSDGVDLMLGVQLNYQLTDEWKLGLGFQQLSLKPNDVNSWWLSLRTSF
ncbi:tandem-95 repeat protein [Rheinheimera sediminis]|uniref:Ig-like domain-containing protein n=1 Tax=Rheinheimera sp. YQF-1 TaxID=2499626 RepID=UPI000FDAAF44|nr:Ig-like domain-containing protein [Rheinheimera sp. YQF-1]RVT48145.1 tandem-95 repeat protein [Rheinheimera sp. YQF-1]